MQKCDVLIAGGGPAGSSCAWKLSKAGLKVLVLDQHTFPRNKVCGGWITPAVLEELQIQTEDYAARNVLQPITGFLTGVMGGIQTVTRYCRPVSYGVRRCEFDYYLLRRCGAKLQQSTPFRQMRRSGHEWVVNEEFTASVVVGAGGHFCPVARFLGAVLKRERVVAAQEVEFEIDENLRAGCAVSGEIPELYFCSDLKGYGWCFRKGNFLNIGLGRMGNDGLNSQVERFCEFLTTERRIPAERVRKLKGHAYLLYGVTPRRLIDDGVLLTGDAAGLAYPLSGEGIRPAIESGLMAADALLNANGRYTADNLESYRRALVRRFGQVKEGGLATITGLFPPGMICSLGRMLLKSRSFSRSVLLDRWFLHAHEAPLI
ncbi:MAG TPA: NAD(P)/FAD-dependent oxidoreductase [Acidobacteriota bacterium]|jgi:geranylgeranyl reductase family protein